MSATQTPINGRVYPMWGQFVDKEQEFIGGLLQDEDSDFETAEPTRITGISLEPCLPDSAMFIVHGEEYDCSFNVAYAGLSGNGEPGWITIRGPYSQFRFRNRAQAQAGEEQSR